MTSAISPPISPPTSPTSVSPTPRQVWTRGRGVLLALVVLLAAGTAMAALRSGDQHGRLDPRSADPYGSRAVAELLENEGVSVDVVTTLDEAASSAGRHTTLLVTTPDLLTPSQQRTLHAATAPSAGRTVLLGAGPSSVGVLAPGIRTDSPAPVSARAPHCSLAAARRAGAVDVGGERYSPAASPRSDSPHSDACYPSDGLPSLLRVEATGGGDTVLLGSPDLLHNNRLAEEGNASLALQLLGSRPRLVWYLPSLSDPSAAGGSAADGESGLLDLLPSGWLWGTFQLFLAALLAAAWRARRLGPLVTEPLPVAVRASEAVEGRARLYRRANGRDHASSVLRTAARARLAPLVGVPAALAHSAGDMTAAVSARLTGTAQDLDVGALLFGPAPADDTALVRLADQLDTLEREVRTS